MGKLNVALQVGDPSSQRWEWVEALVDTGASYTWLPPSVLRSLGLEPTRTFPFVLADGRRIERDMTEARVRYGDLEVTTLIIFGDEGTGALLGAYTLEGLGLAVDTVNRRLIPMTGLLM